jgi:tetratricopeptide (TPR) repeat protein
VDLRVFEQKIRDLSAERRDSAESELDSAIAYESPGKAVIAYDKTKQAALFHAVGRHTEALEACDSALEIVPSLVFAHQLRINVLLDLKRHDELIPACDRAIKLVTTPSAELHELRGIAKDSLEDFSNAIADYSVSLSLESKNPRVFRRRGWSYLAAGANQAAASDFDETIRLSPGDADAYGGRGLARVGMLQHEKATSDAETSLGLDRKSSRIALNAARVYARASVAAAEESRRMHEPDERTIARYANRAVELVRISLDRAPVNERPILWRNTILKDPAFRPITRRLKSLEGIDFDLHALPQPGAIAR